MKKIIWIVVAVLAAGAVVAFILGQHEAGIVGSILTALLGGGGAKSAAAAGQKARARERERLAGMTSEEIEAEIPRAVEKRQERNRIADAAAKTAGEEAAAKRRAELKEQSNEEVVSNLDPELQADLDKIKKKHRW